MNAMVSLLIVYKYFETETFPFSQDAIGVTFQNILDKRDNKLSKFTGYPLQHIICL